MNQVKPYLFWIVCGVVLLLELILGLWVLIPTDEAGDDAVAVASKLSKAYSSKLEGLNKRVASGSPPGLFDAESKTDMENLTKRYLITDQWETVLGPQVKKYDQQLTSIRQELIARSELLHQPVADTEEKLPWYTKYQERSADLVRQLLEGGGVVPPVTMNEEDLNPGTGVKLRESVGLFTRGESFPEADRHPEITTRLRIMERLGALVLATKGEIHPNPVVDKAGEPSTAGMAIVNVEWKQAAGDKGFEGALAGQAGYHQLALTLHGPEAAAVALTGAIEKLEKPIVVVAGSSLSRKGGFKPGDRKGTKPIPVVCVLDLVVLDFTPSAATAAAGGAQ